MTPRLPPRIVLIALIATLSYNVYQLVSLSTSLMTGRMNTRRIPDDTRRLEKSCGEFLQDPKLARGSKRMQAYWTIT